MTAKTTVAPSLDARIAAALNTNGSDVDRGALVDLVSEASKAIDLAKTTIEAETPRLLDLNNLDPDATRQLIESSKLRVERLTLAIPRLQQRIAQIDLAARQAAWTEQADALRTASDDLYWELQQIYPGIVEQMNELFVKARANAAAFIELRSRAPAGVDQTFHEAAPWDGFWLRIMLPDWQDSRITHPLRAKLPDPAIEIALMQAAFAKALDTKMLMSVEQQREIDAKREEELKQKALEDRQRYYRDLQEAERRRATGG